MNTRDLQYFQALVKYKNYTRVAKEFGVSQPTVTQAIKRLEKEFDAQLVYTDRAHRQNMITRSGQLLAASAKAINEQISLAHYSIDLVQERQIRFGLPPIIGKLLVAKIAKKVPGSIMRRVQICEAGSQELLSKLLKGEIDVAMLGSVAPLDEEKVYVQLLTKRPYSIMVSAKSPLAQRKKISFKELANQHFITYDKQYVHVAAMRSYFAYAHIKPTVAVYKVPDISWVKELVRENVGIALMVRDAAKNETGIVPLEIDDPLPEWFYISLAIRNGYVLSDEEQHFVKLLGQVAKEDE